MTFAVCRKLDLSCVSYCRVAISRSPSRDMFDTTNTLHILYHAVKVAKTGTGFSPVRPLNAFWNKMLPVYLMGFNSDNVFVQRKFIINFYMKLKLSSSKSLWRAYHPPPDCLRCDWQGDKKVSLRFPKLLSYPILSPFFFPFRSHFILLFCYALLSCPTDLALPYPILSYPIPSLSIPSHPIPTPSHTPILSYIFP